jgi:hypothetical protein
MNIRRSLLTLCLTVATCLAQRGLTVHDAVLFRDGKPFRAIGINVAALADDILASGEDATESIAAIRYLAEKKVPFIRFWASYYDNWKPYREDPERYWRNMDILVAACEKANVGLVPDLFWSVWNVPYDFNEFRSAWLDPESETRKFMQRYVREFLTRYRERDIVWLWEFSNENNLSWDLPNSIATLPEGRKDNRNIVRSITGILAERAFAEEVRKYDSARPISSGTSEPRQGQFRISTVPLKAGEPWGTDTPEQTLEAVRWTVPGPYDLLSVHHYISPSEYDPAMVRATIKERLDWAAQLHKPLFLGEFGIADRWVPPPEGFDDKAYRRNLQDYFQAIYEARLPLAAYWALMPKNQPRVGAVSPTYTRFQYVMDLIAEYNRKIQEDLKIGK